MCHRTRFVLAMSLQCVFWYVATFYCIVPRPTSFQHPHGCLAFLAKRSLVASSLLLSLSCSISLVLSLSLNLLFSLSLSISHSLALYSIALALAFALFLAISHLLSISLSHSNRGIQDFFFPFARCTIDIAM